MGKQIDKSNLGYLDLDFQYKLTKFFVEDSKFFEGLVRVIDQNAFTDPLLRTFVGTLKDYYFKESVVPSYEVMGFILKERSRTSTEIEEWNSLINRLKKEVSFEGYTIVKETAIKFFKQQNLIKVANKILDIAGKGDIDRYEECQKLFDDVALIGAEDDFGHTIFDLFDQALSNDYTVSIPTGINKLDEVLGGGLDKGKLGLLIAPAGFGKTSFTTAIDSFAATYRCDMNNNEGFKVLQIYFEDDDVDITRKHYSRLTQQEARSFKRLDRAQKEEIAEWLMNHPDRETLIKNLRIKNFRTGTKSATDIEIYLKRLINSGFKPDMVSIDYFECLAPEKGGYSSDSEWTREGVTMRKLENIAKELDIAIWIPTQGTKDSINSPEVVRMDQASGSAKKVHVAQLILSIARALDDIDNNKATIAILKNRTGKSGKVFDGIKFNNGTSTISCEEMNEYENEIAWEEEAQKVVARNRIEMAQRMLEKEKMKRNSMRDAESPDMQTIEGNFVGHIGPQGSF